MDDKEKHAALFMQLVLMVHASAMQHLGKLKNPLTDTVERNLPAAQASIDLLDMLAVKTRGNLNHAEERLLGDMIRELKLNYVDEAARPEPPAADGSARPPEDDPRAGTEEPS